MKIKPNSDTFLYIHFFYSLMNISQIKKQILSEIKPTKEHEKEVSARINSVLKKINSGLKDAKAILGGSGAKDTWLRNTFDADIFVLFDYKKFSDKSDQISRILKNHLKKKFKKISELPGSRNYFQVLYEDFTFEIIPILNIKNADDAKNITDISPLHAKWVLKQKKYSDDVRLVKQFMRASNVYGAESYIRGFSGYLTEILTIYYKGFENLIKNAAKWDDKEVVDPEKYFKNRNQILFELNKAKILSPLVVVDPVQKSRNVAAALSEEKYNDFIKACREFLKKPSMDFFVKKEITKDELAKKYKDRLLLIKIKTKKDKDDITGCRILKVFEYFEAKLKQNDFKIIQKGWDWNKKTDAFLWFVLEKKQLEKTKKWQGPPLAVKQGVDNFKKKYKKTFIEGKRIYAIIERKFAKAEDLIKSLEKDEYVKEKVDRIEIR